MNLLNTDIVSLIHAFSKILSYSNDIVFHSINKEFENAMTIEKLEILDYVNITSKVNIKYSVTNTSIYINNKQDRLIQEVDEKSKINPSYNDYRNAIDEMKFVYVLFSNWPYQSSDEPSALQDEKKIIKNRLSNRYPPFITV
ncbi:hypothetical protein [Faecalibacter bovis]|uniref:Uncharacterized protein n=1 Tax=Faecalibacter bovis TaxID=2898187 RepID=A0ABX7XDH2_9FLAO|nr:hypothetical protein [Faecalibacter bovis]QTV05943.1 hypothetical protein J9309_00920 [Faecalibacter bovis]